VRCVIALISLGINAQQSVANAVGATELQEIINCESISVLRRYAKAYRQLRSNPPFPSSANSNVDRGIDDRPRGSGSDDSSCGNDAGGGANGRENECLLQSLRRIEELLASVEHAVVQNVLHNDKNLDVIILSERLVRLLRGGRITSCKSGKDRTSMAVTAEHARILHEAHGLPEAEAAELMDEMRASGVRWLNMRKNMPSGHYAFNWFQQRLLPSGYRAPKGTWGGGTQT